MIQVKSINLFLVLAIFPFQQVAGSLYPTKPIADTMYTAGQPAQVTWIEDGRKPLLNDSQAFKIDLYARNQTYIATLSKDADPKSLYTTVYIPLNIPANIPYTMRFISNFITQPSQIIYTADFGILPNPHLVGSAMASISQIPNVTTVTSTVVSRITGSQAPSPLTTVQVSKCVSRYWGLGGRQPDTIGRHGDVNVARMKFRLVFMIWPALVGCSMAF